MNDFSDDIWLQRIRAYMPKDQGGLSESDAVHIIREAYWQGLYVGRIETFEAKEPVEKRALDMTIRERFVMAAMEGLLACPGRVQMGKLVELSIASADATIQAMEET